jgi:Zn-finger nucleic acid-binding protein
MDKQSPEPADRLPLTEAASDSSQALLCPACQRIMTKYRIGSEVRNRLDLCGPCGEIWLDGGEWSLLARLDLHTKLPAIFSDAWQRAIRQTGSARAYEERCLARFGTADYERVRAFRDWLRAHPNKLELRNYLNQPEP